MSSTTSARESAVYEISVDRIEPNPDNPRLVFRQGELEQLAESIQRYGVQVPITVFKRGRSYVLIDGERRWRSARKINLRSIPALVQPEPSPLNNLLLMFNIHSLREQWDLLTIAMKLPRAIELLTDEREGRPPTERDLSVATGLPIGMIRRCKLLIALPEHHRDAILAELRRPKSQQQLTEDFFIEMERALTTVARAVPEAVPDREKARQTLISKYRSGVIKSVTELRLLPKLARAVKDRDAAASAHSAIALALSKNDVSLQSAFSEGVGEFFAEQDAKVRARQLMLKLGDVAPDQLDDELRTLLAALSEAISRILAESV